MPTKNTIDLETWLQRASQEQRAQLYETVGTSRHATWQVVRGYRRMSVTQAAKIEEATLAINAASPDLPPVLRTSICADCASCPYAKKCGVTE